MLPTDSTAADPAAEEASTPANTDDRISFEESAGQHLEAALRVDDVRRKNYHIRSALQRVVIAEEDRSE